MRDYYKDFIKEKTGNTPEHSLTKLTKGENQASVSFVSERSGVNPEIFLEDLLKNPAMKEQFDFEVEERTAVMIFDGGVCESEALELALKNVKEIWLALFGENAGAKLYEST